MTPEDFTQLEKALINLTFEDYQRVCDIVVNPPEPTNKLKEIMRMIPEFKAFNKILHIGKLYMSITQKIHGSNAQILIQPAVADMVPAECGWQDYDVFAGSRSRWLTPQDDNYGFCKWVMANREELIIKLGPGRHYGEWAGPGINSGEGLISKTLCLFNWRRWIGKELPQGCTTVPMLYKGILSIDAINDAMLRLKNHGSYLVPGYMKPEGIVIELDGQLYKNVFDTEEVAWTSKDKKISSIAGQLDISYLLQPLRLEKLLSRDSQLLEGYPTTLGAICKLYVDDLICEDQLQGKDDSEKKAELKALGREIYYFVKSIIGARQP